MTKSIMKALCWIVTLSNYLQAHDFQGISFIEPNGQNYEEKEDTVINSVGHYLGTLRNLQTQNNNTILMNYPYSTFQESSQKIFMFATPILNVLYVHIQIKLDKNYGKDFYPMLAIQNKTSPTITGTGMTGFKVNAKFVDYRGYYSQKLYHHILLDSMSYSPQENWYIAFLDVGGTPHSISYTLNVTSSSTLPCPSDCSGKGSCYEGKCDCIGDWIDESCDVYSTSLTNGVLFEDSVANRDWRFYYLEVSKNSGDIELYISKSTGLLSLYFQLLDDIGTLIPSVQDFILKQDLPDSDSDQNYKLQTEKYLQTNTPRKLILGFYTSSTSSNPVSFGIKVNINTSQSSNDDSKLLIVYILISVAVLLFIIWAIITFIKYKYQRPILPISNQPLEELTTDIIEQYMPKSKFLLFHAIASEQNCAVCLMEFENNDDCRNTICNHVFHFECIDKWLIKHQNCPYCRKGLSKKELEEWKINKKLREVSEEKRPLKKVNFNNIEEEEKTNSPQNSSLIRLTHSQEAEEGIVQDLDNITDLSPEELEGKHSQGKVMSGSQIVTTRFSSRGMLESDKKKAESDLNNRLSQDSF